MVILRDFLFSCALLLMLFAGLPFMIFGQETWYVDTDFKEVSELEATAYSTPEMENERGQRIFISTISPDTLFITGVKNNKRHGEFSAFNQEGFIQEKGSFKKGKKTGVYNYYTYDGALFRKEHYNWRFRIKGESYIDQKGREIYTVADRNSRFNEGCSENKAIIALGNYVDENLIKPAISENYDSPFVMVHFIISPTGEIQDVTVENEIHPDISQAVLDLVAKIPNWKPAYFNGEAVYSEFYLSVSF